VFLKNFALLRTSIPKYVKVTNFIFLFSMTNAPVWLAMHNTTCQTTETGVIKEMFYYIACPHDLTSRPGLTAAYSIFRLHCYKLMGGACGAHGGGKGCIQHFGWEA
jgi:hypothetical protein